HAVVLLSFSGKPICDVVLTATTLSAQLRSNDYIEIGAYLASARPNPPFRTLRACADFANMRHLVGNILKPLRGATASATTVHNQLPTWCKANPKSLC